MSSSNSPQVAPSPEKRAMKLRQIKVGAASLRVAVWPGTDAQRTPVFLFNGIGGNLELLEPLVEALGPDLEVISFDVPGTGGSASPGAPYTMRTLARLAAHVLKQAGHQRADVIGVSWGGALALQFAHSHPGRCRRLVLCATMAGMPLGWPASPAVFRKMLTPRRYLDKRYMERHAGSLYGGRFRLDPQLVRSHISRLHKPTWVGYTLQLAAIAAWSSAAWIWRLRQPTLVISGVDDPICPPINGHILARLIPQSRLEILDDGHLFVVAQPEVSAGRIRGFLDIE